MIPLVVPSDSTIRKNQYEKLEKYQDLKEKLEKKWKVKAKMVPVLVGAPVGLHKHMYAFIQEDNPLGEQI